MGKSEKNSKEDSSMLESSSANTGLPPGWTRYTVLIRTEHLNNLKAFAFWSRTPIKSALDKVLKVFFSSREIRPIPTAEDDQLKHLFDETNTE